MELASNNFEEQTKYAKFETGLCKLEKEWHKVTGERTVIVSVADHEDKSKIIQSKRTIPEGQEIDLPSVQKIMDKFTNLVAATPYFKQAIAVFTEMKEHKISKKMCDPTILSLPTLEPNRIDLLWLLEAPTMDEMLSCEETDDIFRRNSNDESYFDLFEGGYSRITKKQEGDYITNKNAAFHVIQERKWFLFPAPLLKDYDAESGMRITTYPPTVLLNAIYEWSARWICMIVSPKIVVGFGSGVFSKFIHPYGSSDYTVAKHFSSVLKSSMLDRSTQFDYIDTHDNNKQKSISFSTKKSTIKPFSRKGRLTRSPNTILFIKSSHPFIIEKKKNDYARDEWTFVLNTIRNIVIRKERSAFGAFNTSCKSRKRKSTSPEKEPEEKKKPKTTFIRTSTELLNFLNNKK